MHRIFTSALTAFCVIAASNMITFHTVQAKWSAPRQDIVIQPVPFNSKDAAAFSSTADVLPGPPAQSPTSQAATANAPGPRSSQPPQLDAAALQRVTARVIGEGSFAIPQIACTVRNRWHAYHHAGLDAVLAAYHAQDVPSQPWQVELVRQVFNGELPCPTSWWYALSLQDTHYWTPHDRVGTIVVRDAKSQVWIFEK